MRRRTFDALTSTAGLALAAILLVAGGLLVWGHSFVDNQVSTQLSVQKIVFPTRANPEFKALPPADAAAMGQYAGQTMTTGAQAKVYADNFIAFHVSKMGGTYSQLSAQSLAQPNNVKLAALVNTVFKGTTLRGMLLNAYAFWQMGVIAFWGALVSFIGAGILLILSAFGLYHARRVPPTAEILTGQTHKVPATA
ncbi:MAG TPA: hypothetical protein VH307_06860 [Streptosporangiaceae bacterium]|nr:hypothetical protein [Streptosporangiaceae bacterium]